MTNDQRNSLFMESYYDYYFTEKKTKEEYSMDKFKKKYKFIPDKTNGGNDPRRGTIDPGNGHRIKVDFGKNKTIKFKSYVNQKGVYIPVARTIQISMMDGASKIILTSQYFDRVKNQKRRDALLQHEIAHDELHIPSERMANNSSLKIIKNTVTDVFRSNDYNVNNPFIKRQIIDITDDLMKKKNNNPTIKNAELRDEILKQIHRYSKSKTNNHESLQEYEADLYASARSGSKNLKKALHDNEKPELSNIRHFINKSKRLSQKERDSNFNTKKKDIHTEVIKRNKNLNRKELLVKSKDAY